MGQIPYTDVCVLNVLKPPYEINSSSDRFFMNNYAHPQPLCPRPILPPSHLDLPPQFSWSEWLSETPTNAYSESNSQRHTGHIPHPSQTAELQYSFENQHALVSSPKFYPAAREFAETAPDSISTHYQPGDSVYIQPPFLVSMPSFEQDPIWQSTHSTNVQNIQPIYYAAHQPVPPEQRSSYSELAPHLSFMNSQAQPPRLRQEMIPTQDPPISSDVITKSITPPLDTKKYALGLPLTAFGRKVPLPSAPSDHPVVNTTVPSPTTIKTKPSRSVSEPRRPSLACTFCRERKIACGRPPDGSPDPTCNQCARRSFKCRYLDSTKTTPLVLISSTSNNNSPLSQKRK